MKTTDKEFEVIVQLKKKRVSLPIIARNAETAKALAERLLRRRGGKSTILETNEKKQ